MLGLSGATLWKISCSSTGNVRRNEELSVALLSMRSDDACEAERVDGRKTAARGHGARISGFSNVGACPRFREFIFLLSSEAFGLFWLTSFSGHEHSTSPRVMFRILIITSRPTIQPDLLTNAGNLW